MGHSILKADYPLMINWFKAKGYSGSLNEMILSHFRTLVGNVPGYPNDLIARQMNSLGFTGNVGDMLNGFFCQKTGAINPNDGAMLFFSNSSLDFTLIASQYPPAYNTTYVKATTEVYAAAYFATDPNTSLIGLDTNATWATNNLVNTNQRFHIDLGSAKVITRIYMENYHSAGTSTDAGVKNFTVQGSNTAGAFADLTYATNTNWTDITSTPTQVAQHPASNTTAPQYFTLTNAVAYRYYAIKFADAWGAAYMALRRIALQG